MTKIAILIPLLAACAVEPASSVASQDMRCQNCGDGGGVTSDQATGIAYQWALDQSGERIIVSCTVIEVGGAVGYDCAVGFDFFGHRYTAGCAVWDNTSAGSGSGRNSCYVTQVN